MKPITLAAWEVRAVLEGRKTQLRVPVKLLWSEEIRDGNVYSKKYPFNAVCRIGRAGDRLWVRETFLETIPGIGVRYRADNDRPEWRGLWKSPATMPRWASRLTLEIVSVSVQRLQEISEEDAKADAACHTMAAACRVAPGGELPCRELFRESWDDRHGKRFPWSSNPWCWRLEFKVVEQ